MGLFKDINFISSTYLGTSSLGVYIPSVLALYCTYCMYSSRYSIDNRELLFHMHETLGESNDQYRSLQHRRLTHGQRVLQLGIVCMYLGTNSIYTTYVGYSVVHVCAQKVGFDFLSTRVIRLFGMSSRCVCERGGGMRDTVESRRKESLPKSSKRQSAQKKLAIQMGGFFPSVVYQYSTLKRST